WSSPAPSCRNSGATRWGRPVGTWPVISTRWPNAWTGTRIRHERTVPPGRGAGGPARGRQDDYRPEARATTRRGVPRLRPTDRGTPGTVDPGDLRLRRRGALPRDRAGDRGGDAGRLRRSPVPGRRRRPVRRDAGTTARHARHPHDDRGGRGRAQVAGVGTAAPGRGRRDGPLPGDAHRARAPLQGG